MKRTAIVKNIDEKLLFEQKCDLLDVIGYFETYARWDERSEWIKSLNGILNVLDEISDQLEPNEMEEQDLIDEITWRALMLNPRDVYMEWLDGSFNNVKELIDLFDFLNDKLNRRTSNDMADMYRDDFMEKLKIDKLI